ncbi:uncharacterized protein DS421_3g82810 [Arachis hypogaea]|nr:uncharacterized protein DS421_3g82810 [Arachis hypogaea]
MVTSFEMTNGGCNGKSKDREVDKVGDAATKRRMDMATKLQKGTPQIESTMR